MTLLSYLRDEGVLDDEMYECLAYDLNKHLYYYGDHFKRPLEVVKRKKSKEKLLNKLRVLNATNSVSQKVKNFDKSKPLIISNAYFGLDKELSVLGYNTISPPWITSSKNNGLYSKRLIRMAFKIRELIELADFNYLVSPSFLTLIKTFREQLKAFLSANNVSGFILASDESFFENIAIKVCKELSIPTVIFLHGLPGIYNGKDGNRSDYLIVWGEKIKELFVKSGIKKEKIFISGHPYYKNIPDHELRFSMENVLVLTKAMGWSQHADEIILKDRAQLILYLQRIQTVLKKLNVKKVKLRPHPSENIHWYLSFLDNTFFEIDTLDLNTSLNNASIIVGPTSSVFLEAIYKGVNYVVFEPLVNKKDTIGRIPVAPFDHSDNRVPIAGDENELINIIQTKTKVNTDLLKDYFHTPFDIRFIKTLLK